MDTRLSSTLIVAAAVTYLLVFGWSITVWSYDTWGVFVVLPPLALVGVLGLRRMFPGDLQPVGTIMAIGLFVKMGGALARYWVGFEAYGGGIDAARYHEYGSEVAGDVWAGQRSAFDLFPQNTGTPFMEEITAIVFTVTGTSLLGGFFVFSWIAYWGTALYVKAACIAIPGIDTRRYAVLMILAPSLVYWPSSIGKEAWMFLCLGTASYGAARLFARKGVLAPVVMASAGLLGAALMRPHISVLWIAGGFIALLVALVAPPADGRPAKKLADRLWLFVLAGIAAVALSAAVGATVNHLDFSDEEGDVTATSIFEETARRTSQAGSSFDPPSISSPLEWPYASIRTLTRPLPIEARGAAQLLSAAETTILMGLAVLWWRSLVNIPRLFLRIPYLAFAMTVLFFGSLAFTSFANLGLLTRQRTLLFPFLLLVLVVPPYHRRVKTVGDDDDTRRDTHGQRGGDAGGDEQAGDEVQTVLVPSAPAGWQAAAIAPTRDPTLDWTPGTRAVAGGAPPGWHRSASRPAHAADAATPTRRVPADWGTRSARPSRSAQPAADAGDGSSHTSTADAVGWQRATRRDTETAPTPHDVDWTPARPRGVDTPRGRIDASWQPTRPRT